MNKRGFTLIELLAVIVILAIIALIATPIVLSIINDSKESAGLRSAEMYLKGVETSVATATLNNKKVSDGTYEIVSGDICLGKVEVVSEKRTCNGETLNVEMNGETPTSGNITIANGKITDLAFTYLNGKTIVKDAGKLVYEKKFEDVCTYISGTEKTAGAKYTCEVKEGTSYNFYVLTTPAEGDTTINLIMDRNICEDGTLATAENKCTVAWQTSGTNADGPVTVMDYLYKTTKDWTNIPNIIMDYEDEGNTDDYGYGTIVTTDNITKITKKDGTAVTVLTDKEGYNNLKSRMPYYSEVSDYDSTNKTNAYLYDYLDSQRGIPINSISGISGYWTLSTPFDFDDCALEVYSGGYIFTGSVDNANYIGIRPVITLKLK